MIIFFLGAGAKRTAMTYLLIAKGRFSCSLPHVPCFHIFFLAKIGSFLLVPKKKIIFASEIMKSGPKKPLVENFGHEFE
jgi:hypothetical protein